jgi:uncharacterized membrane protein
MFQLITGLAIFLGVHSIGMLAPEARKRAVRRFGEGRWKIGFGLASLIGFVLIVHGFGLVRHSTMAMYFYRPPYWMAHVTLLFMLPVFPLLLAAYLPGRIQAAVKHPMLAAVKIWAFAHLLSNGSLADVLLFGGFLAWAVAFRICLKRRQPVAGTTLALGTIRPGRFNDVLAVIVGLGLYALFIFGAHLWLIGVSPLG